MRAFLVASLIASSAVAQAPSAPAQQPPPAQPPAAAPQQAPAAAPAQAATGWMQQYDELWKRRDQPGVEKQLHEILKAQLAKTPDDFDVNTRLSFLFIWQANAANGDLKAGLGKAAWLAGDKAVAARPNDVRGHYFSGTGVGLYSEGVGILTALSQGLEGKFRDRLLMAQKIDKDFLDGSPQVVWGRYFFKLPWPKRDIDQSIRVLEAVVKEHPRQWRGKIYLADSLLEKDRYADARKLIDEVLAAPPGDDPPEEKRMKDLARSWIEHHH